MRCSERKTDNATQHNTTRPRQLFFKEKTASGGIRTHDRPLARRSSYQLSYRGSSAGWARITYTIQSNQSTSSITNQINWLTQTQYEGKGHDNKTSRDAKHQTKYTHDLIIHEMLREKDRQCNATQQKDKATQHNSRICICT